MSTYDRSRLVRWRMGWLPGRPKACRCGHTHASRAHLLNCLRVATRLDVAINTRPNPLDYVLNQLPRKIPSTPSSLLFSRWSSWWPTICQIMLEIEQICKPEGEYTTEAADVSGKILLDKLRPVSTESSSLLISPVD
ncbi:hypothetical protein G6F57_018723 [Rhizopus arrhizus]|uniref:Uncharacterized protein n=1 Tax=Rhizopus oryzae TaxID=64495 RepID=A0A9P7BK65_RHIOR|nr:hypothetical protein G6F24_014700 [Rhizopus arrhizus]KAG0803198.1 hypothetical protein G6F20_013735 [Rhizopus arrhizus]KAG0807772.1 hypothetical protein G6F19_013788 [Rhizopus arrhizus]KAG0862010.1 hypothetical protein G6F16_012857 [Rhizopus arrhizus]KAG0882941.1 hypothetical protein G6F34_013517 [Rhizopus arrhizus]